MLKLNNAPLDKVKKNLILDVLINNWNHYYEIRYRIEAKSGFCENEKYVLQPSIKHGSPNQNDSLLCILTVLFYRVETWTQHKKFRSIKFKHLS